MVNTDTRRLGKTLTQLCEENPKLTESDFIPTAISSKAAAFQINYKTEICRNWESGICEFGEKCAFAHGQEELRQPSVKSNKYKTKKCKQFHKLGYCLYGPRCQFIHTTETSLHNQPTAPSSRKASFDEDSERHRLPIFQMLAEGSGIA